MNTRIGTKVCDSYPITAVIETGEYGWACGYQEILGKKYWCTWEYRTDHENDYYWGHYMFETEQDAFRNMVKRSGLYPSDRTIYNWEYKKLLLEDARRHVDWWMQENDASIAIDNYAELVIMFEERQSDATTVNETWESVIEDYVQRMNEKED